MIAHERVTGLPRDRRCSPSRRLACLGAALAVVEPLIGIGGASPAEPAGCAPAVAVTSSSDGPSPGTLRRAIFDVCAGGTIDFDLPLPALITLTEGDLIVTKPLTIAGPGASLLALTGERGGERVFTVHASGVHLRDLTVSGGFGIGDGAGIWNSGDLEITDAVIANNVIDPIGSGRGAGIYNSGSLLIDRSTISDNDLRQQLFLSAWGAALFNDGGTVLLRDSTVSGNFASAEVPNEQVSGIANANGRVTIVNTTFSGNETGGNVTDGNNVIANYGGTLAILNSTIAGNTTPGYVLRNVAGALTLHNTIVADNEAIAACQAEGAVTSLGFNLVDDPSCLLSGPGDLIGVDPLLLPLDYYDGPTRTYALRPVSPAFDAGDDGACPAADQRGKARPQGARCDIGAFEIAPVELRIRKQAEETIARPGETIHYTIDVQNIGFATTTSAVVSDPLAPETAFVGPVTLTPFQPDAILAQTPDDLPTLASRVTVASEGAVRLAFGATVHADVPPGTAIRNTASVVSDEDALPATSSAEVRTCATTLVVTSTADDGPGSLRDAIAGACPGGTVTFDLGLPATIELVSGPIALDEAVTVRGPGAGSLTILASGDRHFDVSATGVTLIGMTLRGGSAEFSGGSVRLENGGLTLSRMTITGNTTQGAGGGVFANFSTLVISESTISENVALDQTNPGSGGGIYCAGGSLTIQHSLIANNEARREGGGIFCAPGSISNSTVSGNTAHLRGGGVDAGAGRLTIASSTITDNTAPVGGGLDTRGAVVQLLNTIVAGNDAPKNCAHDGPQELRSLGFNLSDDASCNLTQATDQRDTDPVLGPLGMNGGPTRTHALLPGSPAIDAGTDTRCPPRDQRGAARPRDGDGDGVPTCDIGAYEAAAAGR